MPSSTRVPVAVAGLCKERQDDAGELPLHGEDPTAIWQAGSDEPSEHADLAADRDVGRIDPDQLRIPGTRGVQRGVVIRWTPGRAASPQPPRAARARRPEAGNPSDAVFRYPPSVVNGSWTNPAVAEGLHPTRSLTPMPSLSSARAAAGSIDRLRDTVSAPHAAVNSRLKLGVGRPVQRIATCRSRASACISSGAARLCAANQSSPLGLMSTRRQ